MKNKSLKKEIVIDDEFIREKFSNEINIYLSAITHIEDELKPINLLFMSSADFQKIKSVEDMQYIYWLEMIERSYLASITTLMRNKNGLLVYL